MRLDTKTKKKGEEKLEEKEINENMSVKEAAEKLNHSENWIRFGLQQKRFPFRYSCIQ